MLSYFDKPNLDRLLKDFHTVVGIRISVFDDKFNLVAEYPENPPEFCAGIRATQKGLNACRDCDRAAFSRAKNLQKPHVYTCHAGLTEAITPIIISGWVIGYAILAHMMPANGYVAAAENACGLAENFGIEKDSARAALDRLGVYTPERINAAVSILDAIAGYVSLRNFAKWKNNSFADSLTDYIDKNLDKPLSSDLICKQFNCSRSSLYRAVSECFGIGIMQYVADRRIANAKKMLEHGEEVTAAAAANGFDDYCYFCKVFKKKTGVAPHKYKKSFLNGSYIDNK